MRKINNSLGLVLLMLVISFLVNWYQDIIFDKLFVFILIIKFFIGVGNVFCLLKIRDEIKANKKNVSSYCALVILFIMVTINLLVPFRKIKTMIEFDLLESDRLKVIEMIKNNELPIDEVGNVCVPKEYKKVSTGGDVYVYENNKDEQVIGFWILRGMLSSSVELVYSSSDESLIKEKYGSYRIIEMEKLEDHWFYVVTNY